MAYLHDKPMAHLDLKPENVLLTSATVDAASAKVADFGLARSLHDGEALKLGSVGGLRGGTP
eukprot:872832-Prymnesium_polylepis.1